MVFAPKHSPVAIHMYMLSADGLPNANWSTANKKFKYLPKKDKPAVQGKQPNPTG